MLFINNLLSKFLSKFLRGWIGTIIHFFAIGIIYGLLFDLVMKVLPRLIFWGVSEKELEILLDSMEADFMSNMNNPKILLLMASIMGTYLFFLILQIIGTAKAHKVYRKEKEKRKSQKYKTFGESRFSEIDEVKSAGLTGNGIVFGKIEKTLVTKPPNIEGHALIVGGTGTGKTRGCVIPSLLKWEGSALIVDIKGELSDITSEKRKQYGKVYIFNPEGKGDSYDPIKLCDSVDMAQDLARTLIPTPSKGDPIWANSAQALFSAFIFEGALNGYTLSDIAEKLCTTPINELVEHCKNHETREVKLLGSIAYDMPEKTLGGVVSELKSRLITIATDKNIRNATKQSDWTPQTLEEGATIYLKVSEHLLKQYKDLWTIIISQVIKHLCKREDKKQPPILITLDEMARLSKIDDLTSALSTLRSRNVHIMGVIQSMAQLDSIYGKDDRKVIADNCMFKLVLSATDPETQKYFSELAGQKTVFSTGYSSSSTSLLPNMSKTEQGTHLIRPEEWAKLKKIILFAPKLHPTELDLAFWDKEKF